MLARQRILLIDLVLQVLLPLVQHLQLASELQNGFLGRIFLCLAPAKPAQAPAAHVGVDPRHPGQLCTHVAYSMRPGDSCRAPGGLSGSQIAGEGWGTIERGLYVLLGRAGRGTIGWVGGIRGGVQRWRGYVLGSEGCLGG